MSLPEQIRLYLEKDWPVFPCVAGGKRPLTKNGFKNATLDRGKIEDWIRRSPNCNWGIPTGPSTFDVIDIDKLETWEKLELEHGVHPRGPIQHTSRGGMHLLVKGGMLLTTAGRVGPGIDTRSAGGYIVVAPSKGKQPYRLEGIDKPLPDAADWVLQLLDAGATRRIQNPPTFAGTDFIDVGSRNDSIFRIASSLRAQEVEPTEIASRCHDVNRKRCRPPLDSEEIDKIVSGVVRNYPAGTSSRAALASNAGIAIAEWPKPLSDAAYYGLAGEFVEMVAPHTEADPAALLLQFLAFFGATIGRNRHFQVEADEHRGNIFVGLVGESSKARKGTSYGHVRRRFEAAELLCTEEQPLRHPPGGLSSGEGLIWQVRDPIFKRDKKRGGEYEEVMTDAGVDDKRLLVFEGELASMLRVLQRDGNSLSAIVRCAFDGAAVLQTLTKNSPARATGAHIAIIGHITRQELLRYLNRTEIGNGFANRFLWACVKRSQLLPEGGAINSTDFTDFDSELSQSISFGQSEGGVWRSDEARSLWHEAYGELSEGKPGLLGAVTSRAEAQVTRLSILYALLDRSLFVERAHLEAALEVWRYAADSASYIFGSALGDPVGDEILRALRASPAGLTRTEIRDLFSRHQNTQIPRALSDLQSSNLAKCVPEETGGRPAERWFAVSARDGSD